MWQRALSVGGGSVLNPTLSEDFVVSSGTVTKTVTDGKQYIISYVRRDDNSTTLRSGIGYINTSGALTMVSNIESNYIVITKSGTTVSFVVSTTRKYEVNIVQLD